MPFGASVRVADDPLRIIWAIPIHFGGMGVLHGQAPARRFRGVLQEFGFVASRAKSPSRAHGLSEFFEREHAERKGGVRMALSSMVFAEARRYSAFASMRGILAR